MEQREHGSHEHSTSFPRAEYIAHIELTCRRQGVILQACIIIRVYYNSIYEDRCVSKCIYDVCGFSGFLHVHCI